MDALLGQAIMDGKEIFGNGGEQEQNGNAGEQWIVGRDQHRQGGKEDGGDSEQGAPGPAADEPHAPGEEDFFLFVSNHSFTHRKDAKNAKGKFKKLLWQE